MDDDLRSLYQEVILDHNRNPRNFHALENPTRSIEGFNPLCGDHITVQVALEDGRIRDIGFQGSGCAISKSSASIMTTIVKGMSTSEAEAVFEKFHAMVTRGQNDVFDPETMGKLAVFAQVCEFPARVKCASLAWHTLKAALQGDEKTVSTE
jgi:nitrogen fixation NifU-like protein